MTGVLQFFVPGVARPKGSMRSFMHGNKVVITSDNAKLRGWAKAVGDMARVATRAASWTPYGGPMEVDLIFVLPCPQRPKDVEHITKPDLDKLIRGVLDPMTDVVFVDDARVVKLTASKTYQGQGERTLGVHVSAWKK